MKKLNLKLGGIKEMLSREQMKKVVGGDGYGYGGGGPSCTSTCQSNADCSANPQYKTCTLSVCSMDSRTYYHVCTL